MIHVFVRICYTTHVPGKSPVISSTSTVSWERQLAVVCLSVCLFSFPLGCWLLLPTFFSTRYLSSPYLECSHKVPILNVRYSDNPRDLRLSNTGIIFKNSFRYILHYVFEFLNLIYLNRKYLIRTIFSSKGNALD